MRILVLGGSGMAGHTISIYLQEVGHDVTVFSRKQISFSKNINGDATDLEELKNIIVDGEFDAVINAIGILNQDAENHKEKAVILNSLLPHFLSELTSDSKTKIIHMSTDCVFSGKTGNYKEDSLRDGETFYDRSKALGELDNQKDLTFRNSIVGPDINENGIGLFNWFMKQEGSINGYSKAIWTGVTTLTLAKAIDSALKEDLVGIYNLVNNEVISKLELLELFNKYMKDDALEIKPTDVIALNKSLVNTRTDFSFTVPSYDVMIKEMANWINSHSDLYPHYKKMEE